jgi:Protein of unknown function (DUF2782)
MNPLCRSAAAASAAACALLLAAGAARAADAGASSALEPLPEIPAPPSIDDEDLAPQVTIAQKDRETVEEARVNGILVWIKVTPRHGRPYYLIPTAGGNMFIRRDSLDTALKVPMWVLFSW